MAALFVALGAQWLLDGRAPASWRVWLWRVALLQTTLALLPLAPVALAILPPSRALQSSRNSSDGPRTQKGEPQLASHLDRTKIGSPRLSSDQEETKLGSTLIPSDQEETQIGKRGIQLGKPQLASDKEETELGKEENQPLAPLRPRIAWPLLALAVYSLGVSVQFMGLTRSFWRVRRTLRACAPMEDAQIEGELRALAEKMGVSRVPRTLLLGDGAPFLVGVFRPLPKEALSTDKRRPSTATLNTSSLAATGASSTRGMNLTARFRSRRRRFDERGAAKEASPWRLFRLPVSPFRVQ